MNFIDLFIIIVIIFFAIVGFNHGFFKSILNIIGFVGAFYVTFLLKNVVAELAIMNLPFLKINSLFRTCPSINILFYHLLVFIFLFTMTELLYNVIVSIFGLNEMALTLNTKLRLPSKILGIFSGLIEGVIIVFLAIFVLKQPFIRLKIVDDSDVANYFLKNTPLLSNWNRDYINMFDKITELIKKEKMNDYEIALFSLEENMITNENLEKLVELRKINNNDNMIDY